MTITHHRPWPAPLLLALSLLLAMPALAGPLTLTGDPIDYGYEGEHACCVDVAAVNLLNYLDNQPGNDELVDDSKSIGDQQDGFHQKYDPEFKKSDAGVADLTKGLKETFKERNFDAKVKTFYTKDLSYAALLKEWQDGELIILLGYETELKWGHALFLWGLEDDPSKPRVGVNDPNIHPNSDHKIDGANTGSKGSTQWSDVAIGKDDKGLPDWRIKLEAPAYEYKFGDLIETHDAATYHFRITSFVSVSDVKAKVPVGSSLLLLAMTLLPLLGRQRWRNAQ